MEKKKIGTKFEKIIAILCIFVFLQGYFSCFAEIVIAVNEQFSEDEIVLDDEEIQEEFVDNRENVDSEEETVSNETVDSEEKETVSNEANDSEEQETLSKNEVTQEEVETEENQDEQSEEVQDELTENNENEQENLEQTEPYVEPVVEMEVTSENTNIYKGYLYANATSDLKYATDYNTIDTVTITGGKNINSLTVQDEADKILLITNMKIGLFDQLNYKKSRISVEEFNNLLGENGTINLYTQDDIAIGCINKETEVVNGEYVFTYPIQVNSVKFEFTNINDGKIAIKNDKTIKPSSEFSRNQISLFSKINTVAKADIKVGEEVSSVSAEGNINLEETESKMLIDIDNKTISVENKNEVAINVTLKTDEERYDLFENPTIDLEFPSAVENVEITGVTLLYKNGLSIKDWNVTTNTLGRKVVKLRLDGSQLEYTPGGAQQGTTLVVYANIEANRLTADTTENLRMTFTNKDTVRKSYTLEGKDSEEMSLDFVGRQELVRAFSATNDNETVRTIDDKTEKIKVSANQNESQTVTLKGTVVNNYEATLQNFVIVGKIPFVGNLDGKGYDLGTNFDSTLQSPLASAGSLVDIYYSEDGEAEVNSSSWTADTTDVSKYKVFKIVPKEKNLAKGETISFEYNLAIPEKLANNAIGYSSYSASYKIDTQSYTDNCTVGLYTEMKEVEFEDIADENKEEVAELTVGTQVSQSGRVLKDGDSVFERQVLKYSIVVTNNSNKTFSNVNVKANAENANLYTWVYYDLATSSTGKVKEMCEIIDGSKEFEEFFIDKLGPKESKTFEYQVVVKENVNEVFGNIIINSDEIKEQKVETFKTPVQEAEIEVRFSRASTQSTDDIYNGRDALYRYDLYVKNLSDRNLNNIKLYLNMPKGISINTKDISYFTKNGFEYGKAKEIETSLNDNNVMIFDIKNFGNNEIINVNLNAEIDNFDVDTEFVTYRINAIGEIENNKYYSNEVIEKFYQDKTKLEYSWTADQIKEILENEDVVNFELNLKNIGINNIGYLKINSSFPKGLLINSAVLSNGQKVEIKYGEENNHEISFVTNLAKDEQLTLKINAKYYEELAKIDQNILEINASIESSQLEENIVTNTISYKIVPRYTSESNIQKPVENEEIKLPDDLTINNEVDEENNLIEPITDNNNQVNTVIQTVEQKVYSISGMVWIDKNNDGIKQSNELGKKDETISLYSANENGGIDISKKISSTTTDSDGRYEFKSVPVGNYVVMLEFNSELYTITKYRVDNAKQDENSDVISKMISINGENKLVAVSDIISIKENGITNINMGLVEKDLFDLSLEKYIVKATVKNNKETKNYNFDNSTNSKIEIRSNEYKSSIVDITYKMVVKNEGEIEGYVNKIVDYVPEGLAVNLNESPGWYIGTDGGLYYNGLVGTEIKPGETKEFNLVLRKDLSDGESVTIENKAEIAEFTNAYSMKDKDSTELNKLDEDDLGKAILKISVATGKTMQYVVITLTGIIIIAITSRFLIKKKDTKKVFK